MRFRRFLRNRAIGLTRRVMAPAARLREARGPTELELQQVRRRLELLLAGMYGRPMRVGAGTAAEARLTPAPPDILLPATLPARDGVDAAAARYRLLAIEQAERLTRGSATVALPATQLERDLYMMAEGAAVDHAIATRAPRLAGVLAERHARELAERPDPRRLGVAEREVERRGRGSGRGRVTRAGGIAGLGARAGGAHSSRRPGRHALSRAAGGEDVATGAGGA